MITKLIKWERGIEKDNKHHPLLVPTMDKEDRSSLKNVDNSKHDQNVGGRPKEYDERVRHHISWGQKDDDVWKDARDLAKTEHTSISQIVLRSLREYIKWHAPGNPQTSIETFEKGEIPKSIKEKYPEKIINILEGFSKEDLHKLQRGVKELLRKKEAKTLEELRKENQKRLGRAQKQAEEIYQESQEHIKAAEELIEKGSFDRAEEEAKQVVIPSSKRKELLEKIEAERRKLKEQKRESPDHSIEDIEVNVEYPTRSERPEPRKQQRRKVKEQRQTVKKWREIVTFLRKYSSNFSLDAHISRDQLRTVISRVSARGDPPATQQTINKYFDLLVKYEIVTAVDDVGRTWKFTERGKTLAKDVMERGKNE